MKKTIALIIVLLIAVVGGGVYYVLTNLDSLVKQAIEKYGSQATHTAVRVHNVNIQLKKASAAISGLKIANPKGFSLPYAFSLDQIATRLDVEAIRKKQIVIDEVRIKAPEVFYEINAERKGNLNLIKDNLAGGGKTTAGKPAQQGSGKAPVITIRKFVFSGGALHAKVAPLKDKEYNLKLPGFQLTNLKGTPAQISRQVLNQLIDHARAEIRRKGLDAELEKVKTQAKQKLESEKAKLKQKANTQVEQEKGKMQDKLKQLIGK